MKKALAAIALAMVAALALCLVGCDNSSALSKDDPIIGKWAGYNDEASTWEIKQDGTLVLSVNEQDSSNYQSYAMTKYNGRISKIAENANKVTYIVHLDSTPKHCKYKYNGLELELMGESLFPATFGNSDRRSWSKL